MVSKIQGLDTLHLAPLLDNFVHGSVAGISWMIVLCLDWDKRNVFTPFYACEVIIAIFIGCVIDVDHFLAAKSLRIQDALNLPSRPAFHSTSLIFLATFSLYAISKYCFCLRRYPWVFFLSALQHHTRDATRRGYSLPPFGSTPPLPTILYLMITATLPFVIHCTLSFFASPDILRHQTTLDV